MPPSSTKQFSGIFVSYRRDDSSGHAGRLSDKLVDHFGMDRIFMDIDTIEPGEDFVTVIENAVGSCEILIAVIGRNWLSGSGRNTGPLDNPNDFVRLEIATALNRDIRVIPVLVQRASMPNPQDLPADLAKLSRRSAVELSDVRWKRDVDQLISAIEKVLNEQQGKRRSAIQDIEEGQNSARAAVDLTGAHGETPTSSASLQPDGLTGWVQTNWKLLTVLFLAIAMVAAALFGWKLIPTTKQPDTLKTKTASENTNRSSATKEPQIDNHNTSSVAPPGMVYVSGGEFMMGRDDGDVSERPGHRVASVRPFFIDQHETTGAEYAEFVRVTGHRQPPGWVDGNVPTALAHKPVTGVMWGDARDYCEHNHKRLPTEEEWEFAARGADGRLYPWGNNWQPGLANADDAADGMANVETYKGTSPFGVFDMVGNAWEWTASDMRAYPGGRLPPDLPAGELKVIRGGSYQSTKDYATTTYRTGWPARGAKTYAETGFRCVGDVAQ